VTSEPATGFGSVLRGLRISAGLSQEALARRAGLSTDAVAALERGRRTRPRALTLGLLANALALTAADRARLVSAAVVPPGPRARPGAPERRWPSWPTSFVGRERELAEVTARLTQARLLTLTGPGGTGKTRLAVAVALGQPLRWWFVALDSCGEPALVPRLVAAALEVSEIPGIPLADSLLAEAAGLEGLLVLDNCEHVAAAAAELAQDLLHVAPRLRLLATSREVLRVPGEITWPVPALPGADAVRLFAERAALASPGFAIGPDNADAVGRVCDLLDGVPLAIELAAARSRTLTPAQLADRLGDALGVLTAGPRTAMPRHQTLRAAVDWSYGLLDAEQRRMLAWLSVFRGGFDLAAAEAVWAGPAAGLLAALVDRSLVLAEPDGTVMRYRLLEIVRQYARARLAEHGEAGQAGRRHAEHYLRVAREVPPVLWDTGDRRRWLPRRQAERGNFDAALRWAATADQAGDIGAELTCALASFWEADGAIDEGRARLEAALPSARGALRVRILDLACRFAYRRGDYALAIVRKQESADLKHAEGDELGVAKRLSELGLYRICQGDIAAGQALLEQALEVMSRHGDAHGIAAAGVYLGAAALISDDVATASKRIAAAAQGWAAAGDQARLTVTRSLMVVVLLEAGDLAGARALAVSVLAVIAGPLNGMPELVDWVWAMLLLAEADGQDQVALRLLGAIGAWDQWGHRWAEPLRQRYQPVVDRLLERADPAAADELMAQGAAASPPELAAMALAGLGA
jgi:predicted ATPase/DNA-binding XRE family transcriptional regulator